MIRPNKTKTKLQQGHAVFGVISSSEDPAIAEMIGLCGYDFYMLDAEHGAVTPAQAANVVRACEGADVTPLVRVGSKDPKLVLQYLDAGMMGIMMPGLHTAQQVRELVEAVKYPPIGKRGLNPNHANDYFFKAPATTYVPFANEQTLVIPQFEEKELLATLPEILNIAGVDVLMFGPRDLSLSMGFLDGAQHAEVQNVINDALAEIKKSKVAAGITAFDKGTAEKEQARGMRFIATSTSNLIKAGAKAFLG